MVSSVMRLKTAVNAVHAAHAGTLVYLISVIQNTREGLIMAKRINGWFVVANFNDGEQRVLTGNDFAPDIQNYLDHFMSEVEQLENEGVQL